MCSAAQNLGSTAKKGTKFSVCTERFSQADARIRESSLAGLLWFCFFVVCLEEDGSREGSRLRDSRQGDVFESVRFGHPCAPNRSDSSNRELPDPGTPRETGPQAKSTPARPNLRPKSASVPAVVHGEDSSPPGEGAPAPASSARLSRSSHELINYRDLSRARFRGPELRARSPPRCPPTAGDTEHEVSDDAEGEKINKVIRKRIAERGERSAAAGRRRTRRKSGKARRSSMKNDAII